MSPRTEEQFEEIRQVKRQLIMDSALEMFANFGYESTTISQIAKQAGISKGLLYNYFRSKEDLLEDILNKGLDEMLGLFDPNRDGILEPYEMEYFINEIFRLMSANFKFWKLYFSIYFQEPVFRHIELKIERILIPLMDLTVNYFKEAGFKNPKMEAMLFHILVDGIAMEYILKPDFFPIDDIKKELIERYCKPKTI